MQCVSAFYLKWVKQEVRSPAQETIISKLDTPRRPFTRTLVIVLPKRKYTTVQVKMCVVYKDVVQKTRTVICTIFLAAKN
jgi:hypothetical protein